MGNARNEVSSCVIEELDRQVRVTLLISRLFGIRTFLKNEPLIKHDTVMAVECSFVNMSNV